MKRTITEKFDEEGRLVERMTVEEDLVPNAAPNQPWWQWQPTTVPYSPNVWPGNVWYTDTGTISTNATIHFMRPDDEDPPDALVPAIA